jgi:hypothetical protein
MQIELLKFLRPHKNSRGFYTKDYTFDQKVDRVFEKKHIKPEPLIAENIYLKSLKILAWMFFVLSVLNTPLFLTYQYTDIGYLGKVLYKTGTKDLNCEPDYYISEIKESKCEALEDQCLF